MGGRWPLRRLQQANHVAGFERRELTVVYANTPEAHALLRRLKAAGLSRHEPDPVAACEAAAAEATKGFGGMSALMRFTD